MIQTRTVSPIPITQSANGSKMNTLTDKLLTAAISIATTGVVFCCGFMWKTNATLTRIEQRQLDTEQDVNDLNTKMNNVQLDVRATRDDVIELKTLKNQK